MVKEGGYSNHFYAIEEGTVKVERGGEHLADLGPGRRVRRAGAAGEAGALRQRRRDLAAQGDQDRALGAVPDAQVDAPGGRGAPAQGRGAPGLARVDGAGIDCRRHTAGGQGKSGANPARSRHCDRVTRRRTTQPRRRSATGDATASLGKARRGSRKPGDLSTGQPYQPSRKGWLRWSYLRFRLGGSAAAVVIDPVAPARAASAATRASTCGSSTPAARRWPSFASTPAPSASRPTAARTASARAPAAAAIASEVKGATALGAVRDALAPGTRPSPAVGDRCLPGRRFRPRRLRHRWLQVAGLELLVPEARSRRGPGLRQPAQACSQGEDVLWYLSPSFPPPPELRARGPASAQPNVPYQVTVYSYADDGNPHPGCRRDGDRRRRPTGAAGHTMVTSPAGTDMLRATRGAGHPVEPGQGLRECAICRSARRRMASGSSAAAARRITGRAAGTRSRPGGGPDVVDLPGGGRDRVSCGGGARQGDRRARRPQRSDRPSCEQVVKK